MTITPSADLVGYAAATLTTLSFVPQVWHTFRTRDVAGISLSMYSAFTLGIALWLAYGVIVQAWPVIVANIITLALASSILVMKLVIGRRNALVTQPLQNR
jgi:MtN3 and saliva related transmembrane protein